MTRLQRQHLVKQIMDIQERALAEQRRRERRQFWATIAVVFALGTGAQWAVVEYMTPDLFAKGDQESGGFHVGGGGGCNGCLTSNPPQRVRGTAGPGGNGGGGRAAGGGGGEGKVAGGRQP